MISFMILLLLVGLLNNNFEYRSSTDGFLSRDTTEGSVLREA